MQEIFDGLRTRIGDLGIDFAIWRASLTGSLTPAQARRIVMAKQGPLVLEGISELLPESAALLALHNDDLLLPSLAEISVKTAQCLARHRHALYLDGCRSLSPTAAAALAVHGLETVRKSAEESLAERASWGKIPHSYDPSDPDDDLELFTEALREAIFIRVQTLSLAGLRTLDPPVATALGQHKGTLVLDGIRKLDDAAAEELKHHFGSLDLNGLRSLSPSAARALAYGGGPWPDFLMLHIRLRLNGLRTISAESAEELAGYQGTLWLNGLRELTPAVAAALSRFSPCSSLERLNLYGVRRLTPAAARQLVPFEATLCLGGLTSVSVELAEALVELKGRLCLPNLRSLSPEAAEVLLSKLDVTLMASMG
jgi:hypothetical protein